MSWTGARGEHWPCLRPRLRTRPPGDLFPQRRQLAETDAGLIREEVALLLAQRAIGSSVGNPSKVGAAERIQIDVDRPHLVDVVRDHDSLARLVFAWITGPHVDA